MELDDDLQTFVGDLGNIIASPELGYTALIKIALSIILLGIAAWRIYAIYHNAVRSEEAKEEEAGEKLVEHPEHLMSMVTEMRAVIRSMLDRVERLSAERNKLYEKVGELRGEYSGLEKLYKAVVKRLAKYEAVDEELTGFESEPVLAPQSSSDSAQTPFNDTDD